MILRKLSEETYIKGVKVKETRITEMQCNKCLKTFCEDDWGFDNMLHWEDVGGYGSHFGDGVRFSLTLCEICLDEITGQYMIREDDDEFC